MKRMYYRPKTRGELRRKLQQGIPCEVAEYVSEMTDILLRTWMHYTDYTITPSPRKKWVVYEPKGRHL